MLTIDLTKHPNLRFRLDNFAVPEAARRESHAAMERSLAFIDLEDSR